MTEPVYVGHGSWGDLICALGVAQAYADFKPPARFAVYSMDPYVRQLVAAQSFAASCDWLMPPDEAAYRKSQALFCGPNFTPDKGRAFLRPYSKDKELRFAHLSHAIYAAEQRLVDGPNASCYYWSGARLPAQADAAACAVLTLLGMEATPFVLLNPFSFQSNTLAGHWPLWREGIRSLLENCDKHFLLVGDGRDYDKWEHIAAAWQSPRLHNAVGLTGSNLTVLALANRATHVFSCNGSLGHWAVVAARPTFIAARKIANVPDAYYRRWINRPECIVIDWSASLEEFASKAADYLFATHQRQGLALAQPR